MKLSTLNALLSHPLASKHKCKTLTRFFRWGLVNKFSCKSFDYEFIGDTKIRVKKSFSTAELQYYCGLSEFNDMGFLLHFLRKGDSFVDIGANIGSYTLLASGHVGAKTIAFEPVPSTYAYLLENIRLNNIESITNARNLGLSDTAGVLKFTSGLDAINHVIYANDNQGKTIDVSVDTLDNCLKGENPIMLKIDVEGYETMVIRGASETLKNPNLKAIIIELNGLANEFGFDELKIHERLLAEGFTPYFYNPFTRELKSMEGIGTHNTVYLRDIEVIKKRIAEAPMVNVFGSTF
jgi:FkbM family methyltransferase